MHVTETTGADAIHNITFTFHKVCSVILIKCNAALHAVAILVMKPIPVKSTTPHMCELSIHFRMVHFQQQTLLNRYVAPLPVTRGVNTSAVLSWLLTIRRVGLTINWLSGQSWDHFDVERSTYGREARWDRNTWRKLHFWGYGQICVVRLVRVGLISSGRRPSSDRWVLSLYYRCKIIV